MPLCLSRLLVSPASKGCWWIFHGSNFDWYSSSVSRVLEDCYITELSFSSSCTYCMDQFWPLSVLSMSSKINQISLTKSSSTQACIHVAVSLVLNKVVQIFAGQFDQFHLTNRPISNFNFNRNSKFQTSVSNFIKIQYSASNFNFNFNQVTNFESSLWKQPFWGRLLELLLYSYTIKSRGVTRL